MTSVSDKAYVKARLELAKGIPGHLKNKPFQIECTDDDTENEGPKNSSQDVSVSDGNFAGAFMTQSYLDNAIFSTISNKTPVVTHFHHAILDFNIPEDFSLDMNEEEIDELLNGIPDPSNPGPSNSQPAADEFNIDDIDQPESNVRILKPPDGKLNGHQRRAWTKAANQYVNIMNWPVMTPDEISENMKKGKAHLE